MHTMDVVLLGWPEDGVTLDLDHRAFSYAGKFVMSNTGKAIVQADDAIVAAVSFSPDRTNENRVWIRYLTVRRDRRGDAIGPRLVGSLVQRLKRDGYDTVSIGVNNPFSFHACYRADFAWTGEESGLNELVLVHPAERTISGYHRGLGRYLEHENLTDLERQFITDRRESGLPPTIDPPTMIERSGR